MDYMQFVDYHRSSNADITIGCIAYDETRASDFGLMKVRQQSLRDLQTYFIEWCRLTQRRVDKRVLH
jgi:ADP-glucose pyrophosphorylase